MTGSLGKRRQTTKAETRKIILDAAYRLFETKGYEKTTMRALAASAGVGLGTIFQHFPDKAFLLVEAFETDVGDVVLGAWSTMPRTDIKAQLLHIAAALYHFYGARPRLALRFLGAIHQAEGEAATKLKGQMEEFILAIESLFREAIRRGELSPGLDPADAAWAYWSYYFTCLWRGLWAGVSDPPSQLPQLERLLEQLIQGFAGPGRSTSCTSEG